MPSPGQSGYITIPNATAGCVKKKKDQLFVNAKESPRTRNTMLHVIIEARESCQLAKKGGTNVHELNRPLNPNTKKKEKVVQKVDRRRSDQRCMSLPSHPAYVQPYLSLMSRLLNNLPTSPLTPVLLTLASLPLLLSLPLDVLRVLESTDGRPVPYGPM